MPAATIDQDRPCSHAAFEGELEVNRLVRDSEVVAYVVDVRVRCRDCGEPFRWSGVQAGMSPARPMCSADETELHAPIRPASADPDFGLGIPGYAVTWTDGGGE